MEIVEGDWFVLRLVVGVCSLGVVGLLDFKTFYLVHAIVCFLHMCGHAR